VIVCPNLGPVYAIWEDAGMLQLNTCKDAEIAAQSLQMYFFGYRAPEQSTRIPADFITRALELILYLLPYLKPGTEPYVREKLYIQAPTLIEGAHEAMLQQTYPPSRYAVLEHDLRVVVALLRDAQTLTPSQLEQVGALLEPLWDYRSEN
jgi:hypothetical protein